MAAIVNEACWHDDSVVVARFDTGRTRYIDLCKRFFSCMRIGFLIFTYFLTVNEVEDENEV